MQKLCTYSDFLPYDIHDRGYYFCHSSVQSENVSKFLNLTQQRTIEPGQISYRAGDCQCCIYRVSGIRGLIVVLKTGKDVVSLWKEEDAGRDAA